MKAFYSSLLLMFLPITIAILLLIFFTENGNTNDPIVGIGIVLFIVLSVISTCINGIIYNFGSITIWIYKRVYSHHGVFYVKKNSDRYTIYKDGFFYFREVEGFSSTSNDIEQIKSSIIRIIDDHMKKYDKEMDSKNTFKKWSGALTTQEERDLKIKNIIK